jgi:hypothetical protein
MRQLNGVYTQRFNSAHGRCGHVFQGRYKAISVQKDAYLTELSRYAWVRGQVLHCNILCKIVFPFESPG